MIHTLSFDGAILQRGFWLYVWEIITPHGKKVHYVGRTGDSGSPHATSPYQRTGQHLSYQKTQNMLRQNLERRGISPERCFSFRLVAYGPIFSEAVDMQMHKAPRDVVAALEKKLANALAESGYEVINVVRCQKRLDMEHWRRVHKSFAQHFPALKHVED